MQRCLLSCQHNIMHNNGMFLWRHIWYPAESQKGCCSPCLSREISLENRSLPALFEMKAGVARKPPSLPCFISMQPPPFLNHPAPCA